MSKIVFAVLLLGSFCTGVYAQSNAAGPVSSSTFTNPLAPFRPLAVYHGNYYYYMNTTGNNLATWKTKLCWTAHRELFFLQARLPFSLSSLGLASG